MGASGTTQTVTQEADPRFAGRHLQLYDDARRYLNQNPYQAYQGQQIAELQPFQQAAQSYLSNQILGYNPGFTAPTFGSATGAPTVPFSPPPTAGGTGGPGPGDSGTRDPDTPDDGTEIEEPVGSVGGFPLGNAQLATEGPVVMTENGPMIQSPNMIPPDGIYNPQQPPPTNPMAPPGFEGVGVAQNRAATGLATSLGGFSPRDVTAGTYSADRLAELQNPYQQQVIDQSISDLDRARQLAMTSGPGSAGASTYGGSRTGVRESLINRDFLDSVGRTSSQLRSQGFDTAAGLLGRELGLDAQAQMANQTGDLGAAQIGLGAANSLDRFGTSALQNVLGGASALNQFGTQNQNLSQQMINANMDEFFRRQNDPYQRFGLLQGILSGAPVGFNQSSYTPGNTGAGFAGGALSGAGIGANFGPWGAAIGGGLGGLFGLF